MAMTESEPKPDPASLLSELTAYQVDILVATGIANLGEDTPCGADVRRIVQDRTGRGASIGTFYTRVSDLADDGLVEKEELNAKDKALHLTELGREVLHERREQLGGARR